MHARLWLCWRSAVCVWFVVFVAAVFASGALGAATSDDWVVTPLGYRPKECVHTIRSGDHVVEQGGGVTVIRSADGGQHTLPPCKAILPRRLPRKSFDAEGWQIWATSTHPKNQTFTAMTSTFNIPDAPRSYAGGTVFLFPGLQNFDWIPTKSDPNNAPAGFDIIQPVIQYGSSAGGGGDYWALASWYVTLDDSFLVSELVTVQPGQQVFGNMTLVDAAAASWLVSSLVLNDSRPATAITLSRPRLSMQPYAYCTLEVYGLSSCANFPTQSFVCSDVKLYDVGGQLAGPVWEAHAQSSPAFCGQRVGLDSPSQVSLHFAGGPVY